jgi:hypothetical protein
MKVEGAERILAARVAWASERANVPISRKWHRRSLARARRGANPARASDGRPRVFKNEAASRPSLAHATQVAGRGADCVAIMNEIHFSECALALERRSSILGKPTPP